jgi:hypothetical protein
MRPYGRMGIKGRVIVSILAATATIAFSLVFTGWSSFGASTGAPSLRHPTGFRLVPAGFFSQNPAMDAPASDKGSSRNRKTAFK